MSEIGTRPAVIRDLTTEDVVAFWDFMSKEVGFRVVRKEDAAEMEALSQVLDAMGIVDQGKFREKYSTVVPLSGYTAVYLPYEIGIAGPDWSLWGQIGNGVHEPDHVLQCREVGDLVFGVEYLTNPASRAHYEAGAFLCDMETAWRYRGVMLSPHSLASNLLHYGCGPMDVRVATKQLALAIPIVRGGAVVEPASKIAFKWLDERLAA